jgi:hypothetical protein
MVNRNRRVNPFDNQGRRVRSDKMNSGDFAVTGPQGLHWFDTLDAGRTADFKN